MRRARPTPATKNILVLSGDVRFIRPEQDDAEVWQFHQAEQAAHDHTDAAPETLPATGRFCANPKVFGSRGHRGAEALTAERGRFGETQLGNLAFKTASFACSS